MKDNQFLWNNYEMGENRMPIILLDNSFQNAQGIKLKEGLIHILCESGMIVKLGEVRSNRKFESFLLQQLEKMNETKQTQSGNA